MKAPPVRTLGVAVLVALSVGVAARADEPPSPAALRYAEELSSRAIELYRRGDYAAAAPLFEQAYAASHRPAQLKNAAKSYEQAGQLDRASRAWAAYAADATVDAPKREEALVRHAELEARLRTVAPLGEGARPPPPPPAPPREELEPITGEGPMTAPPPQPDERSAALGYALAGGGAAALIGGTVLYFSGWGTYWAHQDAPAEVSRADADGARVRSGAGIAIGVAGAAVLAAALLLGLDED